jgi:spore coat protein U-like protein
MSKLQMKKLAVAVAALGAVAMGSGVAQAANTSGTFNVAITLTSTCQVGSIADMTFTYTSFTGGNTPGSGGGYNVTCTNSLPYTFGLVAGTTVTPPGAPKGTGISVTDAAVGITYTLDLASAGGTGNGAAQPYSITGNIAGPQAGTCSTLGGICNNSGSANKTQTLIVNF